jgi:hypothetical protein
VITGWALDALSAKFPRVTFTCCPAGVRAVRDGVTLAEAPADVVEAQVRHILFTEIVERHSQAVPPG